MTTVPPMITVCTASEGKLAHRVVEWNESPRIGIEQHEVVFPPGLDAPT